MPKIFDSSDLEEQSSEQAEPMAKESSKKQSKKTGSKVFVNEPASRALLPAYAANPVGVHFSTQDPDEQVLLMLRQHPVSQIGWVLTALVLILLPLLFNAIGFFNFLPINFFFAGLIGWYLLTTGYLLESFLKWFYNVYIITDERFIDIDFDSLLYKNISAAKIDNVEDVTAEVKGFLSAIFDYGHIYLQTAAEKREFEFLNVPHPQQVKKVINQLILEEEQEKIEGRVR